MYVTLDPKGIITLSAGDNTQINCCCNDVIPNNLVDDDNRSYTPVLNINCDNIVPTILLDEHKNDSNKPDYFKDIPDEYLKKISVVLSDKKLVKELLDYVQRL